MSETTEEFNNGQSAQFNRNVAKIFLGRNVYDHAQFTYVNSTYEDVTIPAGKMLGRVNASGKVAIMKSGNSDGSQFPCGVLREDHVFPAGASTTRDVYFCTGGDVAEEELSFDGSDTMNTVVDGRIYRDRIAADTVGIKIVRTADDLTGFDNDLV